jgi:hypothetical protein
MTDSIFGLGRGANERMARHQAAVSLSEGRRVADHATAEQAYAGDPAKYVTYQEALREADLAHMRRVVASADANGIPVADIRETLRHLGIVA